MQIRMNHRSCSARTEKCTAPLAWQTKKTSCQETVNAAGHIKHNDQHEKGDSLESSVAQLLRVAVSISQRPCMAATRVLAVFCRLPLPETARKRSDVDPCSPRLGSTRRWIRESVGRGQRASRFRKQTPFDN